MQQQGLFVDLCAQISLSAVVVLRVLHASNANFNNFRTASHISRCTPVPRL
jgi:hypothetical protein